MNFKNDIKEVNHNQVYYIEENFIENTNADTKSTIVHLVIDNDDSEAGKYFNPSVYDYMKEQCNILSKINLM